VITVRSYTDMRCVFWIFFLAAISLAPLGLFLLFWRMFPDDRGIHPIYRDSRSNDTQKDRGIST